MHEPVSGGALHSPAAHIPVDIFISYADGDAPLRDELVTHLAALRQQGLINAWHAGKIGAGEEWASVTARRLDAARVVLLLVSADFLASDICYNIEMKRALARHDAGEAIVVPILLRPCSWRQAPISKLKQLPDNDIPVTKWPDRDEAWGNVCDGITAVLRRISPSSG